MSDYEELLSIIRNMDLSEEQLQEIRAVTKLKEINLDKQNHKKVVLSEEEQVFFEKCSDNRSGKNVKRACPKCKKQDLAIPIRGIMFHN